MITCLSDLSFMGTLAMIKKEKTVKPKFGLLPQSAFWGHAGQPALAEMAQEINLFFPEAWSQRDPDAVKMLPWLPGRGVGSVEK